MITNRTRETAKDRKWRELFERAHEAGMAAGSASKPTAMVVRGHANPLNDASPVVNEWVVEGGVCGFAWVSIKPGGSSFARWLRKTDRGMRDHPTGVCVWVRQFGQSMTRKEAYARAFAEVLRAEGINAYANSRMD